jgi:poly(glycerol-phosphate) alpha-glucosyltransferase
MNIGFATASVSRKGAGIAQAVRDLAHALRRLPHTSVQVFALDDEHTAADRASWNSVPLATFHKLGPAAFGYAPGLLPALEASRADLLHVHGIWMYPSAASLRWSKRTRRPHLVSPHGMLDPWALHRSAWKKRAAGWLFENRHLESAACLHALNLAEAEAIRAYGLRNPVCVIPNGIDLEPSPGSAPAAWEQALPPQAPVLLYFGRLHPKKGLVNLLRAWADLSRTQPPSVTGWFLVLAGWDQSGHEAELRALAESLGIAAQVRFIGPQFGPDKAATYRRARALVLPSFSEGLPVTVLEAWAHRLPVLMTPHCHLPEGFEAGAALRAQPDPVSIAQGLLELISMSEDTRAGMGRRGRALVEARFSWNVVAAEMSRVYAWLLAAGPRPASVIDPPAGP